MVAATPEDESAPSSPGRGQPLWRRLLPFLIALVLVALVMVRVDWPSFVAQLRSVDLVAFVGFMAVFVVALLTADVVAIRYVYRLTVAPVTFRDLLVIRGASYLPSVLNHHVGQAWLTYFLARAHGVSLATVAGGTLLSYASLSACLLVLGAIALPSAGLGVAWSALPLGAGVVYLIVLKIRPERLAKIQLLAPLFEAGVRGHVIAAVLRLPHVAVLFMGTWVPFLFFGVHVPLAAAFIYIPVLMVAVTLPLTPLGIGTRDVLAAAFFAQFVGGDLGEAQKLSAIAASTTTTAIVILLLDVLLGVLLLRAAYRLMPSGEEPPDVAELTGNE